MSDRNVAKLRRRTGLAIRAVMVRGGTDHRKDLLLEDGTVAHLWPDGEIEHTTYRWLEPAQCATPPADGDGDGVKHRVRIVDVVDSRTTVVDTGSDRRVYLARGKPPADGEVVSLDCDGFVVPWAQGMPRVGRAVAWKRDALVEVEAGDATLDVHARALKRLLGCAG